MELHLDEQKPDGVVNEALEQIAYADRVVLNKTDLVGAGAAACGMCCVCVCARVCTAISGTLRPGQFALAGQLFTWLCCCVAGGQAGRPSPLMPLSCR